MDSAPMHPTRANLPQASNQADEDPAMMSPSVRLALRLSTLPSDFFDEVLAKLATLPYDIWDDDAMANADPNVLMRDMNARRARMSPKDKVDTSALFVSEFEQTRNVSCLDQAAGMLRDAIDGFNASGDTNGKYDALRRLTGCLGMRFESSGDLRDLSAAIEVVRNTVEACPSNAEVAETFYTLGELLSRRFNHFKDPDDRIEALKSFMRGLSLLPEEDRHRPLFEQSIVKSSIASLDTSQTVPFTVIKTILFDDVYPLTKRTRAEVLARVGSELSQRFQHRGAMQDLEEAVILLQNSTELDPTNANTMSSYGVSRLIRFERRGMSDDLSAAVTAQKQAVELLDEMDENLPGVLNNLGNVLQMRFEHSGKVEDIDEAINVHTRALYHFKLKEEEKSAHHYSLGIAYHRRFEHLQDLTDLQLAVRAQRTAVATMPEDHPLKAQYLASYGKTLFGRYNSSHHKEDLEESIQLQQKALELTPSDHPARPLRLLNLAQTMRERTLITKELEDIEEAIIITEQLIPSFHNGNSLQQAVASLCLSGTLRMRYIISKTTLNIVRSEDLDRAIDVARQGLKIIPNGLETAKFCNELGICLLLRYREADDPAESDLDEAISTFGKGARHASKPAMTQFICATQWARLCTKERGIQAGVAAFKTVFELIPQLVWIGNDLHRRYKDTKSVRIVLNEAVAIAIKAGELNLALEWAEQGRCIVWSQILQLRQPVNDTIGDTLAGELRSVTSELQNMGMESRQLAYGNELVIELLAAVAQITMPRDSPSPISGMSREEFARRLAIFPTLLHDADNQRKRRLVEKYEGLVEQVQIMPGNDRFMRPKRFSELYAAAHDGPVVFINVCTERCDAIAIVPGQEEVILIPLETFSEEIAEQMLSRFVGVLEKKGVRTKSRGFPQPTFTSELRAILASLWSDVVRPVVLALEEHLHSLDGTLPHITWCTSGPLTFLPLHAAGIFEDKESPVGERVFDHVVSSYTPSITALLSAQNHKHAQLTTAPRLLAVSQPNTPDEEEIPLTVKEIEILQGMYPDLTWINDAEGTKEAVMKAIQEHDWVHFACHGEQNMENPLQSAFLLQDGGLELVDLMKQSFTHTQLAYLSACRTAAGSENFPEEAVHLAAGMLMAGFRNVVATLWAIGDDDATFIAEHFYRYLKEEGGGDSSRAPYALHHAMGKLRESIGERHFTRWIPFIHFGA